MNIQDWAGRIFVVAVIGGALWGVLMGPPSAGLPMIPEEKQFRGW